MQVTIGRSRIELVEGDITRQDTDAIVNAANSSLRGGGGVDGAIHRAGGPSILEECRAIGGCPTGEARMTGGGLLRAGKVIHAVGPVYKGGRGGEAEQLAAAYRSCLELAREAGLRSVSFPSISTGAYGYPMDEAASVALRTAREYLLAHPGGIEIVRFVLFGRSAYDSYAAALRGLALDDE